MEMLPCAKENTPVPPTIAHFPSSVRFPIAIKLDLRNLIQEYEANAE
jgi:hypothetical protein